MIEPKKDSSSFSAFIEATASRTNLIMMSALNQINNARFKYIPALKKAVIVHEIGHAIATHPGGTVVTQCLAPGEAGLCYGETITMNHNVTGIHPGHDMGVSYHDADMVIRLLAGPIMEQINKSKNLLLTDDCYSFVRKCLSSSGKKIENENIVFHSFIKHIKDNGAGIDFKMIENICSKNGLFNSTMDGFIQKSIVHTYNSLVGHPSQRAAAIAYHAAQERVSLFFVGEDPSAAEIILKQIELMESNSSDCDDMADHRSTRPGISVAEFSESVHVISELLMGSIQATGSIRSLMDDRQRFGEAADLLRRESRAWSRLVKIPEFTASLGMDMQKSPATFKRLRALQFSRIIAFNALQLVVIQKLKEDHECSHDLTTTEQLVFNEMLMLLDSMINKVTRTPLWDDLKSHMRLSMQLEQSAQETLSMSQINGTNQDTVLENTEIPHNMN